MKSIEISDEVWGKILELGRFPETPNDVLHRILFTKVNSTTCTTTKRDTTKYFFNNDYTTQYSKRRLAYNIIASYCTQNTTYQDVSKTFPKQLQGSLGVICKRSDVKDTKRWSKETDDITLCDGTIICVCTQWGIDNIGNLITKSQNMGMIIESSCC